MRIRVICQHVHCTKQTWIVQTATAPAVSRPWPGIDSGFFMEHIRERMILMALGGEVMYGWKENFCLCDITACSF